MGGGRVRGGGREGKGWGEDGRDGGREGGREEGGMRDGGNRLYLKKGEWKTITLSV